MPARRRVLCRAPARKSSCRIPVVGIRTPSPTTGVRARRGIAHIDDDDDAGLHIVPLYEERYVVVASDERLIPRNAAMTWADAAQMPLALLKSDMRIRQIIDKAFAQAGVQPKPQIETDSCASLYALVGAGEWATIVPQTWLRAMPVVGTTSIARLVEPDTRAQMAIAINATTPGSIAARAFIAAAKSLALNEVFDRRG